VVGGEQFGDDFFSLDGKQAEGIAMFLVAEGAEAGDFGLRKHGPSRYNRRTKAKLPRGSFFIASACGFETLRHMKIKALFRGVIVLALVFVALYVGMSNPQPIEFSFPLLMKQKISQPAALLFFGMFAIGLVAGVMLVPPAKPEKDADPAPKKKK